MFDGKYAYRFNGFAVKPNIPWHLVGVGVMTIKGQDILGSHTASAVQMQGSGAALQLGRYNLKGTWKQLGSSDDYEAEITFTHTEIVNGNPKQVLESTFAFVRAGDRDGFWLISRRTFNSTTNKVADELVSGEAIRMKVT